MEQITIYITGSYLFYAPLEFILVQLECLIILINYHFLPPIFSPGELYIITPPPPQNKFKQQFLSLIVLIFKVTGKSIQKYTFEAQADTADMTGHAAEGLSGQKIIKAFK
jgi:ABC-type multidrug transport system fused ATPase/permease subunit